MTPRPPSSTPFPYTTLFRSRSRAVQRVEQRLRRHRADAATRVDAQRAHGKEAARDRGPIAALTVARQDGPGDRKSTRLNSSHMSISYAVFCLKKKRIMQTQQ